MSLTLGSGNPNYFDTAIFNAQVPTEGPKALQITVPFSTGNLSYSLELALTQYQQYMSIVQAIFFDTTNLSANVSIFGAVIPQNLLLPPGKQGYIPILAPKPFSVAISVPAVQTADLSLILLNVPVPSLIWPTINGGKATNRTGKMTTGQYATTNAAAQAIPALSSRSALSLVNNSSNPIGVGGNNAITMATALILGPGDALNFDASNDYYGAIYALSTSGGDTLSYAQFTG